MVRVQHAKQFSEDVDFYSHRFVVEVAAGGEETLRLGPAEVKALLLERLTDALKEMQAFILKD